MFILRRTLCTLLLLSFLAFVLPVLAQSGNSGTILGVVKDPSGAVVPNATIEISYPVSGYSSQATAGPAGEFRFDNVPFNPYHMVVTASGFALYHKDVEVRSSVPVNLPIVLQIGSVSITITVGVQAKGEDLIENTSTFHTDVDRRLFDKLPLESQSSSVSSLVTLATPGVAADSNGLFHGIGDHAENSFSIDGQPITDQQSKVFSNQIPMDSIQSMEVIAGAPPAEFGGKTSLVINVTTRSGQGVTTPHGAVTTSYGTFGTSTLNMNASYGGEKWGNFISLGGLNSGRFLDPPEFAVLHDKGNEENFFDRLDFKVSDKDTLQWNLGFTRSWFQTPNTWDQQLQNCTALSALCNAAGTVVVNPITGSPLGPTDQRSQIRTFNIAPTWTRQYGSAAVFTFGAWVRHDQYNYYPSNNPFSDLGPIQDETVSQLRFLTNAGAHAAWSYVKGIHNIKVGATYEHTFLTENDNFGVVNPGILPNCSSDFAAQCATLAPYDLTAGGQLYHYRGHTDVKELALYAQDTITKGSWSFNLGIRGDLYNGLNSVSRQPEPRLGTAYNIKKTNTVLHISYARIMESPFNENLILSGTGCTNAVVNAIMTVAEGFTCTTSPLTPGFRNEFHAGFQQAFWKYFVLSGEYIWKYTHNGYDFNVLGASPITLPIEWHNSKIPGYAIRASVPNFHGFTALVVMSSVAARFFEPTVSGIAPPQPPGVFRIDHDEVFNQTTHLQYQPWKNGPWFGFNWRYDSGLVAGAVPFATDTTTPVDLTILTPDQQVQAGLFCGNVSATLSAPLTSCAPSQYGSTRIKIPSPGTENDDKNPPRIASRNLFDVTVGDDNLFHGDRNRWSLRFTVINLTNKVALYNFLSTFSGTHFVTPRTLTAEIGFHF